MLDKSSLERKKYMGVEVGVRNYSQDDEQVPKQCYQVHDQE
jgi:hypothetical protein